MFFWIFCGSQVLQNGAVSTYTANLADIQTQTRGTSTLAAGYNSSLQGVIPIVLTPAVGWFFDHYGWRMAFGESSSEEMPLSISPDDQYPRLAPCTLSSSCSLA